VVLVSACGAGWHQTELGPQSEVPPRQQVQLWMTRDGRPLHVRRGKSYDGSYRYETVGDSLPLHNGPRAVFQFYIAPGNPTKVHTLFADSRTGVWNDTVRACVSEWPR